MNPILGENDQTPSKTVYHVTCDFKFYWVAFCPNLQTATSRTLPTELRKHNESVTSSIYKIK